VRRLRRSLGTHHSPFIRHIVRRTREFLETTLNPETNEPYLKPVRVRLYGEDEDEAIVLPTYLRDAYVHAEEFCDLLKKRVGGAGFLKTLLLRRVGSTIEAGRLTAEKMLGSWVDIDEITDDDEDEGSNDGGEDAALRSLTPSERQRLQSFVDALKAYPHEDPKYAVVQNLLLNGHKGTKPWLDDGCIIFSAYFDSIRWLATKLSTQAIPNEPIGIYAGSGRSAIMRAGVLQREDRENLKAMVRKGELRLILGTDAASEGLNLQRLGTLINLDLPWNPTRLEQRKGRIQRIGQIRDVVSVYNMRYRDSVEDRVHALLSERLQEIHRLFGQIPDVLEDVWVQVAEGQIESAKKIIDALPGLHPFEERYNHRLEPVPWESCSAVLNAVDRRLFLQQGWDTRGRR
jgi:superfamily II DNA or RNA helicase